MTKPIDAILLAAGASSRMAPKDKMLLPINGQPMLRHVAMGLLASSLRHIHVIVPKDGSEARRDALSGLDLTIHSIPNDVSSMGNSLACGVSQLASDCTACLVVLGDMPGLTPQLVDQLITDAASNQIHAPIYQGKRGHPVVFGRDFFPEMSGLDKDEGARSIIKRHQEQVKLIEVEEQGCLIDLDTPEDYQAYLS